MRRRHVLQQLHLFVEVQHEAFVLVFAQQTIDEIGIGLALIPHRFALSRSGVGQNSKCQRQVPLLRKLRNRLCPSILLQDKVLLSRPLTGCPFLSRTTASRLTSLTFTATVGAGGSVVRGRSRLVESVQMGSGHRGGQTHSANSS